MDRRRGQALIPLAAWGGGEVASADGLRFVLRNIPFREVSPTATSTCRKVDHLITCSAR